MIHHSCRLNHCVPASHHPCGHAPWPKYPQGYRPARPRAKTGAHSAFSSWKNDVTNSFLLVSSSNQIAPRFTRKNGPEQAAMVAVRKEYWGAPSSAGTGTCVACWYIRKCRNLRWLHLFGMICNTLFYFKNVNPAILASQRAQERKYYVPGR